MKFVEKKCPGCGAALKFGENDSSVVCEYCGKELHIQRDEKKYERIDAAHKADAFKFVDEYGKPIVKAFAVFQIASMIIPFVIFIVAFIVIAIFTYNSFNSDSSDVTDVDYFDIVEDIIDDDANNSSEIIKEEVNKPNYVTKLSQIDNITLETFYDEAKSKLIHMDNSDYTVGEWKPVGTYLLVSANGEGNKLYVVMKHTYTKRSGNKKITLYAAGRYTNLTLNSNNIVVNNSYFSSVTRDIDLDGKTLNFATGFESIEKLYNNEIRSQIGDYTLEASAGLYTES